MADVIINFASPELVDVLVGILDAEAQCLYGDADCESDPEAHEAWAGLARIFDGFLVLVRDGRTEDGCSFKMSMQDLVLMIDGVRQQDSFPHQPLMLELLIAALDLAQNCEQDALHWN